MVGRRDLSPRDGVQNEPNAHRDDWNPLSANRLRPEQQPPATGDERELDETEKGNVAEPGTRCRASRLGRGASLASLSVLDSGDDEVGVEAADAELFGAAQEVLAMTVAKDVRSIAGVGDLVGEAVKRLRGDCLADACREQRVDRG